MPVGIKRQQQAALANNFTFWVVEKPKTPADHPLDLIFETDPIGFANQVRGGLTSDTIYGFYLEEADAQDAAHDQVTAVFEAAKALEEKKLTVTEKIEKTIAKLQKEATRCMKEGNEERAKAMLEKITKLKAQGRVVEASKKPLEEISYEKSELKNPKKADLDKNKDISKYEQKRGKAVEKSMNTKK